jgi:hypothetical protein
MGWGPSAPKTDGMNRAAEANAAVARRQQDLAEQEAAIARERQAQFDPLFMNLIEQSMASQQTQDARSAEQWDLYREIGLPAERELSQRAMEYDTPGRRDAAAAEARAGVAASLDQAVKTQNRDIGRRGGSLSSGQSMARDTALRFAGAKQSAGADRQARALTEATGMSLMDSVANRGRGIASTGLQAAQLALQGGGTASGQLGQNQGTYNASLAPTQAFFNGAVGANGSAANIYGNVANIQRQSSMDAMSGLLGLGKLGATLYTSSRKAKTVHGKVSGEKALRSLEDATVYDWTYKDGAGDGGRHVGRMAGDVEGDPMDGHAIDLISEFGRHHAAISHLASKVRSLEDSLKGSRA